MASIARAAVRVGTCLVWGGCTDAAPSAGPAYGDVANDTCTPIDPGAAPLRRLTPEQYANTLRDLFPDVNFLKLELSATTPGPELDHVAENQHPSALFTYQAHQAAVEAAARITAATPALTRCGTAVEGGQACVRDYIRELLPRALRRPAEAEELADYVQLSDASVDAYGAEQGAQLVLQTLLQDPNFLYLAGLDDRVLPASAAPAPELRQVGPYALASRLSYFLWNSLPDNELWRAAADAELLDVTALRRQAERLLGDARAHAAVLNFFRQVFEFDKIDAMLPKDIVFAQLPPDFRVSLRGELERLVIDTVFTKRGTLADLLVTNETWVDETLARIYEVEPPAAGTWEQRRLDPTRRAGLLTTPGFLAAQALFDEPSPVRRGVFVLSRLLCSPPPPPGPNVDTSIPEDIVQRRTNRERFAAHVSKPECVSCHTSIDGIGFGFESYDAIGRFRTTDNGFAVDDSGHLDLEATSHTFHGAVELAQLLAREPAVHACMLRYWLSQALGRSLTPADACTLRELEASVAGQGGNFQELMLAVISSDAFRYKRQAQP